jgi:hypothetical protein
MEMMAWSHEVPAVAASDRLLAVTAPGPPLLFFGLDGSREWRPPCAGAEWTTSGSESSGSGEDEADGDGDGDAGAEGGGPDDVRAAFLRGDVLDETEFHRTMRWSPCGGLLAVGLHAMSGNEHHLRVYDPFGEPDRVVLACASALRGAGVIADVAGIVLSFLRRPPPDG